MSTHARPARDRASLAAAALAIVALVAVPWGANGGSSAAARALTGEFLLGTVIVCAVVALACVWLARPRIAALASVLGVVIAFVAGFAAGPKGTPWGLGPLVSLTALLVVFAWSLAGRGLFKGDRTVALLVIGIATLLLIFVLLPVGGALVAAILDGQGHIAPGLAIDRLFNADIWSMGCLTGTTRCGVAVNSLVLATLAGVLSTLLGLVLALVIQRGGRRFSDHIGQQVAAFVTAPVHLDRQPAFSERET